ncbi:MAG: hypothetical protein R2839_05785 [Thermomicrobiales bacterium]
MKAPTTLNNLRAAYQSRSGQHGPISPENIDTFSDINLQIKDLHLFLNVYIAGIEVTQSIQYYESDQHLTDAADRDANNAIRLVANKPAWVRVYLGSIFGASGINGTLEVQRRTGGIFFLPGTTLNPTPHPNQRAQLVDIQLRHQSRDDRFDAQLHHPCRGDDRHIATDCKSQQRLTQHRKSITIEATLRQTLRLAGVMISYNGPSSTPRGPESDDRRSDTDRSPEYGRDRADALSRAVHGQFSQRRQPHPDVSSDRPGPLSHQRVRRQLG